MFLTVFKCSSHSPHMFLTLFKCSSLLTFSLHCPHMFLTLTSPVPHTLQMFLTLTSHVPHTLQMFLSPDIFFALSSHVPHAHLTCSSHSSNVPHTHLTCSSHSSNVPHTLSHFLCTVLTCSSHYGFLKASMLTIHIRMYENRSIGLVRGESWNTLLTFIMFAPPPDYEKLIQNDASHLQDITGITIDLMVIKY